MAAFLQSLYVSGFGASAASGSVSFYAVGTLTPATVFSDDALLQPQTQPIVLDANGKSPLPVYTATPLRAIIKDVSGVTLQDIARIDGDRAELVGVSNPDWPGATDLNSLLSLLRTSLGGPNGTFLDPGAGAVSRLLVTKFEEVQISVKDFGAKGDGLTDDTSAIQAAVNRVIAIGGGKVYLPPGAYVISSAISIAPVSITAISFNGAAKNATSLRQTSTSANGITASGQVSFFNLSDISILANTSSSGTAVAVAGQVNISNLNVSGFNNGISGLSGGTFTAGGSLLSNIAITLSGTSTGFGLSGALDLSVISDVTVSASSAFTGGVIMTTSALSQAGTVFNDVNISTSSAGGFGIDIPANASPSILINGGSFSAALTNSIRVNSANTSVILVNGTQILTAMADARVGLPVAASLAVNGSVIPGGSQFVRIIATAAITITVQNPIYNPLAGTPLDIACINNSGGAVVWNFGGAYKLVGGANPAPATGNVTMMSFRYDHISAVYRETTRATAAI
jgi:hypothetical protein